MKYAVLYGDPEGEMEVTDDLNKAIEFYLNHPGSVFYKALTPDVLEFMIENVTRKDSVEQPLSSLQKY